jgi:predicted DNA-binding protein
MTFTIQSTPYTQYPLRLDHELHQRFTHLSATTKIPKSTLGRLSIVKLIHDIETRGITTVLHEIDFL